MTMSNVKDNAKVKVKGNINVKGNDKKDSCQTTINTT